MVRTSLLFIVFVLVFFPSVSMADMEQLTKEQLSNISGRAGLTIVFDTRMLIRADTIAFSDTDSNPVNWISLNGFTVDDGTGQGFQISTMDSEPFVMDAGTTADGRTLLQFNLTPFANPISFHVQNIVFSGQDIGGADINLFELSPASVLRLSHHMDGSSGIEFDAGIALDVGSFNYTYNLFDEMFSVAGIQIGGTATGVAEDPSTWGMAGLFSIGNLTTSPGTMDINTDSTGYTSLIFNLPVSGSIRIKGVSMGGTSFGPMVIDNIIAHRLNLSFSP
ncbi:MAG: hypothetical protein L3J69_10860 [Desulfobacula sp.]|nr:hypothetical protein [Desulfobacula sp.]